MDLFPYLFHSVEIIIPEYIRVFPNGKPGKRISQGKMPCRQRAKTTAFFMHSAQYHGHSMPYSTCFQVAIAVHGLEMKMPGRRSGHRRSK
jgi:hypothetical protein